MDKPWTSPQIPFNSSSESFALRFAAWTIRTRHCVQLACDDDLDGNSLIQAGLSSSGGSPLQAFNLAFRGWRRAAISSSKSRSRTAIVDDRKRPGAVSCANFNSSVPFVVTVQRLDAQDPTASSSSEPAQAPISARSPSPLPRVGVPPRPIPKPSKLSRATTTSCRTSSDPPATAVASAEEAPSDSGDAFNVRVPTGPLASRNAGPLGPILASVGGDPTPEVDRLGVRLSGNRGPRATPGTDHDEESSALAQTARRRRVARERGPVAAVSGADRLPLASPAQSNRRRTDLSGLLASIGNAADAAGSFAPGATGSTPARSPSLRPPSDLIVPHILISSKPPVVLLSVWNVITRPVPRLARHRAETPGRSVANNRSQSPTSLRARAIPARNPGASHSVGYRENVA